MNAQAIAAQTANDTPWIALGISEDEYREREQKAHEAASGERTRKVRADKGTHKPAKAEHVLSVELDLNDPSGWGGLLVLIEYWIQRGNTGMILDQFRKLAREIDRLRSRTK